MLNWGESERQWGFAPGARAARGGVLGDQAQHQAQCPGRRLASVASPEQALDPALCPRRERAAATAVGPRAVTAAGRSARISVGLRADSWGSGFDGAAGLGLSGSVTGTAGAEPETGARRCESNHSLDPRVLSRSARQESPRHRHRPNARSLGIAQRWRERCELSGHLPAHEKGRFGPRCAGASPLA